MNCVLGCREGGVILYVGEGDYSYTSECVCVWGGGGEGIITLNCDSAKVLNYSRTSAHHFRSRILGRRLRVGGTVN